MAMFVMDHQPYVTLVFSAKCHNWIFFFFKWDQPFGGDLSCNAFSFIHVACTYGIKGEQLIGPTLLLKLRASWSTWIHRIMVSFGWTSLTTHVEENGSNFLINQYHILFLCFYLEYNWYSEWSLDVDNYYTSKYYQYK